MATLVDGPLLLLLSDLRQVAWLQSCPVALGNLATWVPCGSPFGSWPLISFEGAPSKISLLHGSAPWVTRPEAALEPWFPRVCCNDNVLTRSARNLNYLESTPLTPSPPLLTRMFADKFRVGVRV